MASPVPIRRRWLRLCSIRPSFEKGSRYHRKHTAGRLRTAGRMCFQGQLGDALDVAEGRSAGEVAASGALFVSASS